MEHFRKFLLAWILILPWTIVLPQNSTYDLYRFTEPGNWKKEERKGMVIYTDINDAEGTYGQIGLYANRESTNDAANEFMKDWNELAARMYSVPAIPDINVSILDEYWKVAQTTVPASVNGQNFTMKMVNFTGLNKTATIIANYTGDVYKSKIEEFILGIKMDAPVVKNEQVPAVSGGISESTAQGSVKVSSVAPVSMAYNQSFSNLTFSLPAGWEQQLKGNYLSVFPSKLKQGEMLEIRVLQPLKTDDYTSASAATWLEINQAWQDELHEDIFAGRAHTTSLGWNYFSEKKHTRRTGGVDTDFELFLIANDGLMERVIVISEEFRVEGNLYSTSTRFFDDIYNFVFPIRLAGKPAEAVTVPLLEGGLITGVWTGISGGFSGYSGTYDQKTFYAVFYNSGVVYFRDRLPDHGLYQHNPLVWQYVHPNYWGTYTFSGNQGTIESKYYNTMPLVLTGGKLTITKNGLEHSYTRLASPDGMKLKGTWAFETGESITFNSDGTFSDNGALGIIEHSLYYKPYTVTVNPGNGRYEIRDFTAIFTYSDGQEFRCAFPSFDIDRNNPSPVVLVFGRDDFLRLK